jgi:hypothetical protein
MEYWNDLLTGIFKKITRKIINNIFKYLQQDNMKLLYTTKKTSVKIILTCSIKRITLKNVLWKHSKYKT